MRIPYAEAVPFEEKRETFSAAGRVNRTDRERSFALPIRRHIACRTISEDSI